MDKYRNKAIKGKDIVREENTKLKDKKKAAANVKSVE